MKALKLILFLTGVGGMGYSQQDTITHSRSLDSVIVISYLNQNIIRPLSPVQGSYIFSGKKTEVIDLAQAAADITNKKGRQLFAKIPGVFVYDKDGAGNQVKIASRGLDPHRGWEFNNRKNGITRNIEARFSVNNVTDKKYFTKRPTFYPGPGVWPSEGKYFSTSFIIRV